MTEKEYWYWFCMIEEITQRKKEILLSYFQTPEVVYYTKEKELRLIGVLNDKEINYLHKERNVEENYAKLKDKGIYFVTRKEKEYPNKLKHIYDAPLGLWVKGNLPNDENVTIAIVGARNCSNYGKEIAYFFAKELSKRGVQVVSGLARGIDGFAHSGALAAKGKTFGILGCGIDIIYPLENQNLYEQMKENGGILSEFPLESKPLPFHFPIRNRIISGLSDGILVVEAKEKSGSLITADLGLEQGRDIFAIPGRIQDKLSEGCNNLIREGAQIITKPQEILDNYGIQNKGKSKDYEKINNLLETKEEIVYANLSLIPKHMNEIMGETKLNLSELIEILLALELKGYIKQTMKHYYSIYLKD